MSQENKTYKKTHIGAHKLKPESLMMSYGYDPQLSEGSVKPPAYLTSTFVFSTAEEGEEFFHLQSGRKQATPENKGGLIYSRFNHPNIEMVEDRMALLEGSEAAAVFSSGMGAISGVLLGYLRPGDVVLCSTPLYGGTETLIQSMLKDFGIGYACFQDGLDAASIEAGAAEAQKKGRVAMIFVESPANPTNTIVDFELIIKLAELLQKEQGLRPILVCDTTLAGPIMQKVVPQGIDLAVYSLTKYVGGHSDLTAGAVCGSAAALKPVRRVRSAMGFNLEPHTGWMISRSMETLTLRMHRASESALKVAEWIHKNPYISTKLYHPLIAPEARYEKVFARQCLGAGSTFSFSMDVDKPKAFALINNFKLFKSAVSLGGTESLVCHPASTTHSGVPEAQRKLAKVTDGLIRLSIGLEHPDDLIADLDQAFKAVFGRP